jgi:hypothetical protein
MLKTDPALIGARVYPNAAITGQPPAAVWTIKALDPDTLHAIIARETHTATVLRFPLAQLRLVPVPN